MTTLKSIIKRIFQYEARLILRKYQPKIITITGSVGKTTTRDAIYTVLAKKFFVRKSEKSFTAELGAPLTIIGCSQGSGSILQWLFNIFSGLPLLFWRRHYPDWLILEIDGDKQGDFRALSSWLHPDILVVTAIGAVPPHVESFGNIENLFNEKKILLDSVVRTGTIVYNADDSQTVTLVQNSSVAKLSCGTTGECDIRGFDFDILYGKGSDGDVPTGMSFDILRDRKRDTVTIFNSIGIHNEYACLLAYAVGELLGVTQKNTIDSLNQYKSLPGRMNIIAGVKNSIILDDSYNASPVAMHQAIDVFKHVKCSGKKIAVLGDMLELGKYSTDEHRALASLLYDTATIVMCVGIRSRVIAEALVALGFNEQKIISTDTPEEAGREVERLLKTGDLVLVKGSQAMRMERVVEEIIRHPEDKAMHLVRQEPEWLSRN